VRHVTYRDDEVAVFPYLAEVAWPQAAQRQMVPFGGGNGTRGDRSGWMGAGRCRRYSTGPAPQRRRQMRAGRVRGAHEQHPRRARWRPDQRIKRTRDKPHVTTTAVTLRTAARDKPGLLKRVQMVREQVGRHRQQRRQLRRGRVASAERVDDLQPGRVGQRRMHRGPARYVTHSLSVHWLNLD